MNTQAQPTSTWSMYRAIVGIGLLCALLIVTVYQTTEARIADNRERALQRAISEVLPQASHTLAVAAGPDGVLDVAAGEEDLPVFLGYGPDNELLGAAITAQGMGYQDNIRVLYAYSFAAKAIVGFKILESKETPGLGDRVEKEPHFLANFERLDATLAADGSALRNAIVTVKQGEKTAAWQIDGITGATITSVAIGKILNGSAGTWAPVLERDSEAFATRETQAVP